jgi:hypothetical protein
MDARGGGVFPTAAVVSGAAGCKWCDNKRIRSGPNMSDAARPTSSKLGKV